MDKTRQIEHRARTEKRTKDRDHNEGAKLIRERGYEKEKIRNMIDMIGNMLDSENYMTEAMQNLKKYGGKAKIIICAKGKTYEIEIPIHEAEDAFKNILKIYKNAINMSRNNLFLAAEKMIGSAKKENKMERLTREDWKNQNSIMWERLENLRVEKNEKKAIKGVLKKLATYEDAQEKIEKRIEEIKNSSCYPHNFTGQMAEDLEWVLSLLTEI